MANPTWFVAKDYLVNKLAQLQATEPEGNWDVYSMAQAFANSGYEGEEGAYQHFLDFGMDEDVSPNALFDVEAYYANKLDALKSDPKTAEEWADKTVDDVKDAFDANGLSAWEHYQLYGTAEGINPSAGFDTMKYLQAKTDAMNAAGGDKVWTVADIADAFAENGLNAIEHYELYGRSGAEGEVSENYNPAPVVTLTFAKALAAETLPDEYFLEDGAASLEDVAVADLEAAQAKAQSIFDGALNKADLEYSVAYTLSDTLANIMAADAAVLEGHAYTLTDGVVDLGDGSVEAIVAAQAAAQALIDGSANETKPELAVTYTLSDTLANIMAADAAVLEGHAYTLTDGVVDLGDGSVEAIVAAQAAAQALIDGSANETKPELAVTYTLSDSLANIMDPANADMVTGAGSYALTDVKADLGEVTVDGLAAAQLAATTAAQAVIAGATNASELGGLSYTFVLNDTVAHIQDLGGTLPEGATGYILTDTLPNLKDASDNLFHGAAQVFVSGDVATIDDANVADAVFIGSLDGIIYNDTFANLQNADRIGDANVTYTLTDAVTNKFIVTEVAVANVDAERTAAAEFVAGATNGAEYADTDYGYTILDTIANIKAASNKVLLHAEEDGVTVSDTLAAFNTDYDILTGNHGVDNAIATVAGDTTISSATMKAIAAFDTNAGIDIIATADSAVTVDASKDTSGAEINLSAFNVDADSKALTFNAKGSDLADTITANDKGGVLIGGAGVDSLKGADGVDVFAYTATTFDALKLEVGDTISTFTTGIDSIQLTKAIEALLTTTGDKINLVATSSGTLDAGNGARLIINDGNLILDQSGDTTATGGSLTDDADDDIVILAGINDLAVADIHFA